MVFKRYPDLVTDFVDQLEGSQKLSISDAPHSQLEGWMGSKVPRSLLGEH